MPNADIPHELTGEIWIIKHGVMQEIRDEDSGKDIIKVKAEEDDDDE